MSRTKDKEYQIIRTNYVQCVGTKIENFIVMRRI